MENVFTVGLTREKSKQPVYTVGEEIFNVVSHAVGALLGIVCLIYSVILFGKGNIVNASAMTVYSLSMIILYTFSSLYHAMPTGKAKRVFRIFDHCTIYLLIAGTYSPYCLIGLGGYKIGKIIFIVEWVLAFIGISMNAVNMNNKAVKIISMFGYLCMGWCIILTAKLLIANLSTASFILLVVGGVAYTMGTIFYGFGKRVKYFHPKWHLFVLAGTVFQLISILFMI